MRKIIHCDCDCFYAAIEMRDDPSLQYLPVAVGGASDRRGVIATCNYLARSYGVRSAMPTAHAKKLCPSLLVLPPAMDKYRLAAQQVRTVFQRYTRLIEPLSLDEAYLDVSETRHYSGSATLIAQAIRQQVKAEVGISISAGVAPNKFLAKVASDWNKPDGLMVVTPDQAAPFARQLPVEKIHGVGRVMAQRLDQLGVRRCEDLLDWSQAELLASFGKFGQRLYYFARGIDDRELELSRLRKSISVEHTYAEDLPCEAAARKQTDLLLAQLVERYRQHQATPAPIRGVFVKLKSGDFQTTTVERRIDQTLPDLPLFHDLLTEAWQRLQRPVRLLGLGLRLNSEAPGAGRQLSLAL